MKSATELAATFSTSPEEQKRQAVALRRLAGGVRAAAERKESTGLSDKEVKALLSAVAVLDTLATAHSKAQKLVQQRRDAQEVAERAIRAEMKANFGMLESVPDQVALVAAVSSYHLRDRIIPSLDTMSYYFKDSIDGLSYSLSKEVVAGRSAQEVVAEAWAKFESGRANLRERHAEQIRILAKAAEEAQQRATKR